MANEQIGFQSNVDYVKYLDTMKPLFVDLLKNKRRLKVSVIYGVNLDRGEDERTHPFRSKTVPLLGNARAMFDKFKHQLVEELESFLNKGSGWVYTGSDRFVVHLDPYKPFAGGKFLDLPAEIKAKKAVINLNNNDDFCFKWCITRHFNPVDSHANRVSKLLKEQSELFDWSNCVFPMEVNKISKFEKANGVSVNVYGYDTQGVFPIRISKNVINDKHVDLLLHEKHYCLVSNLHRLVSDQITNSEHRNHFCRRCLNGFTSEERLKEHITLCNRDYVASMPEEGSVVKFKNYNRQMKIPFVVYADFETYVNGGNHVPSSFCYYLKSFNEKVLASEIFESERETDVGEEFTKSIMELARKIAGILKKNKKMILTEEDEENFGLSTNCCICGNELGKDKVRDHCHLTGEYRGAAHKDCNINFRMPKFLPVYFHNMSGYDIHLFIKKLGGKLRCIPQTEENYISVSTRFKVSDDFRDTFEIRFLDSFKFMSSSLDMLSKSVSNFENLNECFGDMSELLKRKGVYPYEWITLERMNATELPTIECFYSKLSDSGISEADYEYAKKVWNAFGCTTFTDYHSIYNVSDVLILADIFEGFRKVCMKTYKLDPAWYYTSPGLSWDAMLKMTKVELDLLSDPNMLDMIKKGIRGGISMISNRFSHANNKYMIDYDLNEESKYITYLDANNLYGWAMSQKLPYKSFKWMNESELSNWREIPCILMVDLEYSKELHDLHNDYPLAPESMIIDKVAKLVPNLFDKKDYVLHSAILKQYIDLGLKLTRVTKGIKLEESEWLKPYIDMNTNMRTQAKTDFEKDFYKLMNNSVFGKTMENIENRVDIRLAKTEEEFVNLSSKSTYVRRTPFGDELVAVHMKKTRLKYDKPIYVGMSILDLSKTLMYDFHYNHMKVKYGDKLKLLFTDTDSFMYEVKTDDLYEDMLPDLELYDTSDFPKEHKLQSNKYKKVIGKMKSETNEKVITEFVGLRPKLYSFQVDGVDHKKCKGVSKGVTKKKLTHKDYVDCLKTRVKKEVTMVLIASDKHELSTKEVNKIALSADDTKRIIMEDGIRTFARGHYLTRDNLNE